MFDNSDGFHCGVHNVKLSKAVVRELQRKGRNKSYRGFFVLFLSWWNGITGKQEGYMQEEETVSASNLFLFLMMREVIFRMSIFVSKLGP
jgi:hypothetical protein